MGLQDMPGRRVDPAVLLDRHTARQSRHWCPIEMKAVREPRESRHRTKRTSKANPTKATGPRLRADAKDQGRGDVSQFHFALTVACTGCGLFFEHGRGENDERNYRPSARGRPKG